MRDVLDRWSWPARRWVCDHLVGHHAYSKNLRPEPNNRIEYPNQGWTVRRIPAPTGFEKYGPTYIYRSPFFFDQEAS